MSAAKVPLKIDQGSDFAITVTWRTGDPPTLVDLTGCTAEAQIREYLESPDTLIELSTANGGIVLGGTAGTVEIIITHDQTEAVEWVDGVYDLEVTFANGSKKRLLSGTVTISPEITR